VLEPEIRERSEVPDTVQVVVFNDGDRSVGMVVDQIIDVAEEAVAVRQQSRCRGLLGSGVVGKLVTDFLDLGAVIDATSQTWSQDGDRDASARRVLIADGSEFSRAMIRSGLDMAGYGVVEAANLNEVIRKLELQPVDLIVTTRDLPPDGNSSLLSVLGRRPGWEKIPVLLVTESAEELRAFESRASGFRDCQMKFDRLAILESVAKLVMPATNSEAVPELAGEKR
jgi:two-component system chemotaxis sensor kinase CheA